MTENEVRTSLFIWLNDQVKINGGIFTRKQLEFGFPYKNEKITLIGPQGIWKPRQFNIIPISITSVSSSPYKDSFTSDGLLEYKYRGTDPRHRDNIGLKEALRTRTPLVYFHSIKPGKYIAVWPIFILQDFPEKLTFLVAIDPAYAFSKKILPSKDTLFLENNESSISIRKYVTAITKTRLHQTIFRENVLSAYKNRCSLCLLHHPELLDAAHIIPDSEPHGDPIVQNGISLCKIHHTAYDQNIIGISPEYIIKIRKDIIFETDGPMLKHGLQELNNKEIMIPKNRKLWPDRDRLYWRYKIFLESA